MIDHVTVGRRVWAAARRRGTPLVFDLVPGFAQRLGKVVVHRAGDGHRVGGSGLRLLVVFPEAATEMLFDHRVTGCVGWKRERENYHSYSVLWQTGGNLLPYISLNLVHFRSLETFTSLLFNKEHLKL